MSTNSLLSIAGVRIEFGSEDEPLVAVRDVSLDIAPGEVVGLVGESGSGKSLTCRSVMRLVAAPGRVADGRVTFDGRDVLAMESRELRAFRANDVGMIFQDPFSSLNPVFRIGDQLMETLRANRGLDKAEAKAEAIALLERVGIPDPPRRLLAYPHELSGGMRQRIMIALATASEPRLLIADEPTTALDVTTQAQILALLLKMRDDLGMAVLLVSHDFGVIAQVCDRVAVMYGGHIVETGPVEAIYDNPQHPYTRALLESVPELESAGRAQPRAGIPGQPPELGEVLPGCVFAPRCAFAQPECLTISMDLAPVGPAHACACPVRPFAPVGAVPAAAVPRSTEA
ncbi:MAG TPA: ABC transporter ATP-binding protein [Baekduia sp.]|jgi:oligopeptide/dipeptide ABC transporter ATP-binding protein